MADLSSLKDLGVAAAAPAAKPEAKAEEAKPETKAE